MASFLFGNDYLALPRDPHPWVIKDLIPIGGLANLYGKPKEGKSFAALGMALAVANPTVADWLGFPVNQHGTVAYLQIDTPRGLWSERILELRDDGKHDFGHVAFCDMLMTPYPYNILEGDHVRWLKNEMESLQPLVVFIDTLREVHGGDEDNSTVMRNVITNLVSACRPAAIVLVSHTRKDSLFTAQQGGDDLMTAARGSSYVPGKMDTVMRLTPTGFTFKGRGAGSGRIEVDRDELGMVVLDPKETTYHTLVGSVVDVELAQDPLTSVNALAEAIQAQTDHKKKRAITEDVKDYLLRKKIPLKVGDRKSLQNS